MNINEKMIKTYFGEIEFEFRDSNTGEIITTRRDKNIIKIFSKEILAHRAPSAYKWDPLAGSTSSGYGAWVPSGVDPREDFSLKYILLGASFDSAGRPLDTNDDRFYQQDPVTGIYVPKRLEPGAYYDGGLINPIPINEYCHRPLKRIEDFRFEPTYQPAGTPLLQEDVRAMNNILICETMLRADEYNGFYGTGGDCFTITEVALAAGRQIDTVEQCDILPRDLFLEGPYEATAIGGSNVVQLGSDCTSSYGDDWCPFIEAGDQIKITGMGGTDGTDSPLQVSPYYLVLDKDCDGRNLILDRVPTTVDGSDIDGPIWVYKSTLRLFSHRILSCPARKSPDYEIIIRWFITFS